MSIEGKLGEDIQTLSQEYNKIPSGIPIFLKIIEDFYKKDRGSQELSTLLDLFSQLFILVYRESKKQDPEVSNSILYSFINDFSGTDGSCIYPQWETMINASLAFKRVVHSNYILVWEQAKNLVQAYNEFLNGLLGFFIVGWRCAKCKNYNINVFNNNYGSKLNEFSQLTGGEDGAFYLIFRIAKPKLRNAIAHGSIWLDADSSKVKFTDNTNSSDTHELNLEEFISFAGIGSHLGHAYLAAIASIVVIEEGTDSDISRVPTHIVRLFRFSS